MLNLTEPTLTDLWHKACREIYFTKRPDFDSFSGTTFNSFDNVLRAKSMEYTLDVGKELWLTKLRFGKLQRDYIDPVSLEDFIEKAKLASTPSNAKRGVVTQMHCRLHGSKHGAYTWGNCMLAMTFRPGFKGRPPMLGLHSRAVYIGYMGGLDLALCHLVAREIADRIGRDVKEFEFVWYVDNVQWHGMKCLAYIMTHPELRRALWDQEEYPKHDYPTVAVTRRVVLGYERKWRDKVPADREHEAYGPNRRLRQRYNRWRDGDPYPSVPFEVMNLGHVLLPRDADGNAIRPDDAELDAVDDDIEEDDD